MTLADILNAPTEKTFEGKTYKLREPTILEQGMYQRWLETLALDAIERSASPDEKKERDRAQHYKNCAVGDYEWGNEICVRRLQTIPGFAKLLEIVLKDQGMTLETAERWADTNMREAAAVIVGRVVEDPKAEELQLLCIKLGLPRDFLSNLPTRPSTVASTTSENAAPTS